MTVQGFRYYGRNQIGRGRHNRLLFPDPVFNDPRGGQIVKGARLVMARDSGWHEILIFADISVKEERYTPIQSKGEFTRKINESDNRLNVPGKLLVESDENDNARTTKQTSDKREQLLSVGQRIHFVSRLDVDVNHVYLITDSDLNTIMNNGWRPEEYIDIDRMNGDNFYRDIMPLSEIDDSPDSITLGLQKHMGRVLALGSAQDGGIPHLDCACPVCNAARNDEENLRKINSLQVNALGNPDKRILFEATPDIRYQIEEVPHHIFLSHDFSGHISGLISLSYESINAKKISVYCTEELAELLKKGIFRRLLENNNIELNLVPKEGKINIGCISIGIIKISYEWGETDALAYRISGPDDTLCYMPIVAEWTEDLISMIKSADLAIVGGLLWEEDEVLRDHIPDVCIKDTMATFDARDVETPTYFTRLNHTNEVLAHEVEYQKLREQGFRILDEKNSFII